MLARVVPKTRTMTLLSIPRDLWVQIAGMGQSRINSAFNNGPNLLISTIQKDLGIPINHFVEINFDTFQAITDAVGGVKVWFPTPAKDAFSLLSVPKAGCVNLTGLQALAFARSRHYQYLENGQWLTQGLSDLARIQRQQFYVKKMISKAEHKLTNPVALNAVLSSVTSNLTVDRNFSTHLMLSLAEEFHSANVAAIPTLTLPTFNEDVGGAAVLGLQQPQAAKMIASFNSLGLPPKAAAPKKATPPTVTPTTTPGSHVPVLVANGSGTTGQATAAAAAIRALGYAATVTGQTPGYGNSRNNIEYAPGAEATAKALAAQLSGGATVTAASALASTPYQLELVTGQDYAGVATRPRRHPPVHDHRPEDDIDDQSGRALGLHPGHQLPPAGAGAHRGPTGRLLSGRPMAPFSRRGARPLLGLCCYALTAGLSVVALGRASGRGTRPHLLAAEAAVPALFLATGANLALALKARLRIPAVVSTVVAGAQIAWIWPAVARRQHHTGHRGELRLLAANVLYYNSQAVHLADQLRGEDPDVVLLIEASRRSAGPLIDSGAFDAYPHRSLTFHDNASGFALFSRFPLLDVHLIPVARRHILSARIMVKDRSVQLFGVHTRAPTMGPQGWVSELQAIGAAGAAVAGPLVIAGDFNAARDHVQLRRLQSAAGVRDAHDTVGRGLRGTWPADRRFPPLFRLDHILVSKDLSVSAASTGTIPGSDHRWIRADLSFASADALGLPTRRARADWRRLARMMASTSSSLFIRVRPLTSRRLATSRRCALEALASTPSAVGLGRSRAASPRLLGLRVARALLLFRLPVVADLLEGVLQRPVRHPVGPGLVALVGLFCRLQGLGVGPLGLGR